MKRFYLLVIAVLAMQITQAQIVNIPDADFKIALLNHNPVIDTNNDGEIQVSEAEAIVTVLNLNNKNINSLVGIEAFVNLEALNCNQNDLLSLDISNLTNLKSLYLNLNNLTTLDVSNNNLTNINCNANQLTSLNLNSNIYLKHLQCSSNQLTSIDVSNNTELLSFYCADNSLTTVDVSNNQELRRLECQSNQLQSLYIKNNDALVSNFAIHFDNNPNLAYICADEDEMTVIYEKLSDYGYTNTNVNSYCSFTPGGTFYTIQGETRVDLDGNGCDINDNMYPALKLDLTDGTNTTTIISDSSGNYSVPVQDGSYTVTPQLENPTYFTVSPASFTVNFPTDGSPFTQDFCITPNGTHNDLEITVIPANSARPDLDLMLSIN